MRDQGETAARPGLWSLESTQASVAAGERRIWAMVETALAIAAFWWVALTWETLTLVYTSLVFAPLIFLRSDASTRRAVAWFDNGFVPGVLPADEAAWAQMRRRAWALSLGIGAAIGAGGGVSVAPLIIAVIGDGGFWAAFLGEVGLLNIVAPIAAVIARAVGGTTGAGTLTPAVAAKIAMVSGAAIGASIAGSVVGAIWFAGSGGAAVWGVALAIGLTVVSATFAISGQFIVLGQVSSWLILPGSIAGLVVSGLLVRLLSVACHVGDGFRELPTNMRKLVCCTAPGHKMYFLPGLPPTHAFHGLNQLNTARWMMENASLSSKIAGVTQIIALPFWFAPSWVYRMVLKSTLWLWWVLYFIGGAPDTRHGVAGLRADYLAKSWARVQCGVAVFGFAGFAAANIAGPFLSNQVSDTPVLPLLSVVYLANWGALPLVPLLGAASAICTIVAWFWADAVFRDSEVPGREVAVASGLVRLGYLGQLKTGLGWAFIALVMVYAALLGNAAHHWVPVSDWAYGWLVQIYGDYAAALRPGADPLGVPGAIG